MTDLDLGVWWLVVMFKCAVHPGDSFCRVPSIEELAVTSAEFAAWVVGRRVPANRVEPDHRLG